MPETSAARGTIGRASYDAVRAHIEHGKKATEAFTLVAEATGRSKATVQAAYYSIARSLPGGGGVKLRRRAKATRGASGRSRRGRASASVRSAGKGRRRVRASRSASTAALEQQLRSAAEALLAHIARLEEELASARVDSARLAEIERAFKRCIRVRAPRIQLPLPC
jgi:hypothetical protein